jgi:hypothetical protein
METKETEKVRVSCEHPYESTPVHDLTVEYSSHPAFSAVRRNT